VSVFTRLSRGGGRGHSRPWQAGRATLRRCVSIPAEDDDCSPEVGEAPASTRCEDSMAGTKVCPGRRLVTTSVEEKRHGTTHGTGSPKLSPRPERPAAPRPLIPGQDRDGLHGLGCRFPRPCDGAGRRAECAADHGRRHRLRPHERIRWTGEHSHVRPAGENKG
jgi:hypothetical protein